MCSNCVIQWASDDSTNIRATRRPTAVSPNVLYLSEREKERHHLSDWKVRVFAFGAVLSISCAVKIILVNFRLRAPPVFRPSGDDFMTRFQTADAIGDALEGR
ncbi:unnamed protein product, partial [Amoebophrya sp. A25]|eukprot:GSA25T00020871001.1